MTERKKKLIRVFCDCDDTLIRFLDHQEKHYSGIYDGSKWEPNYELITAVRNFREFTPSLLIVWSGGGKEYAKKWARTFFNWGEPSFWCLKDSKAISIARDGDIIIDDSDRFRSAFDNTGILAYTPEAFIEKYGG